MVRLRVIFLRLVCVISMCAFRSIHSEHYLYLHSAFYVLVMIDDFRFKGVPGIVQSPWNQFECRPYLLSVLLRQGQQPSTPSHLRFAAHNRKGGTLTVA